MSAVSNSVMPRSIALWITLREASRSMRWPKLLQPSPTAETRKPEPPRLRVCMGGPELWLQKVTLFEPRRAHAQAVAADSARGDAATRGGQEGNQSHTTKKCGPGQTRRLTGTAGGV